MRVEEEGEGLDGEGGVGVETGLFEAVEAEDAAEAEGVPDQQVPEEGLGAGEGFKGSLVAPKGLGQLVLLSVLHFLLYTNANPSTTPQTRLKQEGELSRECWYGQNSSGEGKSYQPEINYGLNEY